MIVTLDNYNKPLFFFVCLFVKYFFSLQTLEQEEKDNEAVSKMMALDQKNQLLNLFHEKNRPTLAKWPQVELNTGGKPSESFDFLVILP